MTKERLEELTNLGSNVLKRLINHYENLYEKVINESYEEGWDKELIDMANRLTNIISDYKTALHYKNMEMNN